MLGLATFRWCPGPRWPWRGGGAQSAPQNVRARWPGDATQCGVTGVTLRNHVHYKEIRPSTNPTWGCIPGVPGSGPGRVVGGFLAGNQSLSHFPVLPKMAVLEKRRAVLGSHIYGVLSVCGPRSSFSSVITKRARPSGSKIIPRRARPRIFTVCCACAGPDGRAGP